MVLFYCNLNGRSSELADLPPLLTVERKKNEGQITPLDLEEIIRTWNSTTAYRSIRGRFAHGASLWMIKSEGKLAGYGWSLRGRTIERHYYRLGPDDVHLFDFYVFPQYRGRGLNPLLVTEILRNLAIERMDRAFIEAAEWNQAQLASLRKTPFHRLGRASKFTILQKTIIFWDESPADSEINNVTIDATSQKGSRVQNLRA
ncbi:MAG: GNAT family N-acetyltransferase [Candidatus Sulfotelmatobacter sp.]|jgi:ribosomal protein S18 acetylase RimI-like enzyme